MVPTATARRRLRALSRAADLRGKRRLRDAAREDWVFYTFLSAVTRYYVHFPRLWFGACLRGTGLLVCRAVYTCWCSSSLDCLGGLAAAPVQVGRSSSRPWSSSLSSACRCIFSEVTVHCPPGYPCLVPAEWGLGVMGNAVATCMLPWRRCAAWDGRWQRCWAAPWVHPGVFVMVSPVVCALRHLRGRTAVSFRSPEAGREHSSISDIVRPSQQGSALHQPLLPARLSGA